MGRVFGSFESNCGHLAKAAGATFRKSSKNGSLAPIRSLRRRAVARQVVDGKRGRLRRHGEVVALREVRGGVDPPHPRLAHPLPLAVWEVLRVAVLVRHVEGKGGRRVRLGVDPLDEGRVAVGKVSERQPRELEKKLRLVSRVR